VAGQQVAQYCEAYGGHGEANAHDAERVCVGLVCLNRQCGCKSEAGTRHHDKCCTNDQLVFWHRKNLVPVMLTGTIGSC